MEADLYFLIEYPIYRAFDGDDINVLSRICSERKIKKNGYVFKEGDPGYAMYIIKKGVIKIYKETSNRKKLITILSEGEFFGEMALIDGSDRSASAIAGDTVELVELDTEGFNKLKNEFSSTGFKVVDVLLKFMSHRIRRTTKKAASLIKGRKKASLKTKKAKKTKKKAIAINKKRKTKKI